MILVAKRKQGSEPQTLDPCIANYDQAASDIMITWFFFNLRT
jgi:hypothetical protein